MPAGPAARQDEKTVALDEKIYQLRRDKLRQIEVLAGRILDIRLMGKAGFAVSCMLVAAIMGCSGSRRTAEDAPRASENVAMQRTIIHVHIPWDQVPIRVSSPGGEVGVYKGYDLQFEVEQPIAEVQKGIFPTVKVQALLPCGWRDAVLEPSPGHDMVRGNPARASAALRLQVPTLGLYVDNRSGEETEVRVGDLKLIIPERSSKKVLIPAPDCSGASRFMIKGKAIGDIPPTGQGEADKRIAGDLLLVSSPGAAVLLVDIAGGHCYRLHRVTYGDFSGVNIEPLDLTLSEKRVYSLPRVPNSFLSPAPETVKVPQGVPVTTLTELAEIPCRSPGRK